MDVPWPLKGMKITMVGAAKTGRAVARFLVKRGARVTLVDQAPEDQLPGLREDMEALGVTLSLGGHRREAFLRADGIVLSPGVPPHLDMLLEARRRDIPVVSELEMACWFLSQPMAAITGTNGKTTTCTMAAMALREWGKRVFAGGNIGRPLIEAVDMMPPPEILVVEVSSFQLECTFSLHPMVAVMLNLKEDHLDRHQSWGQYAGSKARIFQNMGKGDVVVVNLDDTDALSITPMDAPWALWGFTMRGDPRARARWNDPWIELDVNDAARRFRVTNPTLRSVAGISNLMASTLCCVALGCPLEHISGAADRFGGLEHRMEQVAEAQGVRYINDSKATNVAATVAALDGFEGPVILIAGGKDKGLDMSPLRDAAFGKVKAAILMGEAGPRMAEALSEATMVYMAEDMLDAVRMAVELAAPGDVVLLSPACSSFDLYRDYKHRGEEFSKAVLGLLEGTQRREGWRP